VHGRSALTRLACSVARHALTALLAAGFVASGCSVHLADLGEAVGGSPAEAAQIVEDWIAEARSGKDDLGWSRLYPSLRDQIFGSYEVYQEAVLGSDWSRFEYVIQDVRIKDGDYLIDIRVPGGAPSTPAVMVDWGIVQFVPVDGVPTDVGSMTVQIPPLGGDRGIQGPGRTE
jgi:hypothetical protein